MSTQTAAAARFAATWRGRQRRGSGGSEAQRGWDRPQPWADRIPCAARLSPLLWCARDMRAESALAHGEQEKTGMFEVPPLCENESDDAPNGSYDLISSFGTYTDRKRHGSSPKKMTQNSGVNPLPSCVVANSEHVSVQGGDPSSDQFDAKTLHARALRLTLSPHATKRKSGSRRTGRRA